MEHMAKKKVRAKAKTKAKARPRKKRMSKKLKTIIVIGACAIVFIALLIWALWPKTV
jgi:uncharacterized membrane protein